MSDDSDVHSIECNGSEVFRVGKYEEVAPGDASDSLFVCACNEQEISRQASVHSDGGGNLVDMGSYTDEEEFKQLQDLDADDEVQVKRDQLASKPSIELEKSIEEASTSGYDYRRGTRHIFVLSEAGKPIYSRYGREEECASVMGIIQALVSFVQTRQDCLQHFRFGDWKFVFLLRDPLILVAAGDWAQSGTQLELQLSFVFYQILSILTRTQLVRIFEQRKNFDLRRLLSGTEKSVESMLQLACSDPALLLQAVRCLPMTAAPRDAIGQAVISSASKVKDLVFVILIVKTHLVTMVRMKKFTLHPGDLHLLINLVICNPSFKNAESWSPICLPRFDDTGFLHAHISYLDDSCPLCLVMLTVDRNAFFTLSDVRSKISEKLKRGKSLQLVTEASAGRQGVQLSQVGIGDLWHFLYKNRTSSQLCSSAWETPYMAEAERRRLLDGYLGVVERMVGTDSELKIFYNTGDREAILGWITSHFELYAAFSPAITKQAAVNKVDKLMKWLKKEEDRLFILNPLVF